MSKREIFGIKIFFTGIILFVITLSILNSCSLFHGSKMSKNKLKKEHHLADGSFKNIYASSINKPFSDLIKWSWNRTQPEPFNFKLDKNDPKFLKENREIPSDIIRTQGIHNQEVGSSNLPPATSITNRIAFLSV